MQQNGLKALLRRARRLLRRAASKKAPGIRKREQKALWHMRFHRRPRGKLLRLLLQRMGHADIKPQAFDAILLPRECRTSFSSGMDIFAYYHKMRFIDVKTTSRSDVGHDFKGYFFSISENQIKAAEALGPKFKFCFYNVKTGDYLFLSLSQVLARAKHIHISLSVQF